MNRIKPEGNATNNYITNRGQGHSDGAWDLNESQSGRVTQLVARDNRNYALNPKLVTVQKSQRGQGRQNLREARKPLAVTGSVP